LKKWKLRKIFFLLRIIVMYLLNGNNCRRIVPLYIMIIYVLYYNNVVTVQCNLCVAFARARSLRRRHQFGRVSRARLAGHQVLSRPCVSVSAFTVCHRRASQKWENVRRTGAATCSPTLTTFFLVRRAARLSAKRRRLSRECFLAYCA